MMETKRIAKVDRWLEDWSEFVLAGDASASGYGSSTLAAVMDGMGEVVRSTVKGVSGLPDLIFDVDRAVNQLKPELKAVVFEHYVNRSALAEQRLRACGCSSKTYYRRLARAHQCVLFSVRPERKLVSRKVRQGKKLLATA